VCVCVMRDESRQAALAAFSNSALLLAAASPFIFSVSSVTQLHSHLCISLFSAGDQSTALDWHRDAVACARLHLVKCHLFSASLE
jgi:hypothetical protein